MSSFNFPTATPTVIPSDTNVRASRVSTIYPTQVLGPYTTWKLPVRVATTANITLSGLPTIDGIVVKSGDRVLVKNQTTTSENGIYVVFSSASATDYWLRANDLQGGTSAANTTVFVNEGTVSADMMYICTYNMGLDTVGVDNLVFVSYGSLGNTGVVAGSYTNTNLTVNSKGLITAASNGSGGSGSPSAPTSSVQYNNAGAFGGSGLFTFDPTAATIDVNQITNLPILGTVSVGQSVSTSLGLIKSPDSTVADDATGLVIKSGSASGTGMGGPLILASGSSVSGNGGPLYILAGDGGNVGENISMIAGSGTIQNGYMMFTTSNIPIYFKDGGVILTKDTTMTIADLASPPTVTTTSRQGIISISDPSALANGTSINITVDNVNVAVDDTIYVSVNEFNTSGDGIPMVLVSSKTVGTRFIIQLYNIGAAPFSASQIKISFVML